MPPKTLKIAPGLALPIDAVTETFAWIGTRGGGKTYGAKVMVEEMLGAGLQVVIIDPMPAWWGLRASADSKGPGLDIAIIGGSRGDVPLEAAGGVVAADLVAVDGVSAILDLSELSKGKRRQFVVDFAERLYEKNREPMHLVVEEADMFVPQNARGEERMEGAFEDLVRRGRGRGIGISLLSQRPQVVNKNVLELSENFIAFRALGTRSRDAIDDWFDAHADKATREEVSNSLPSLDTGEAWFYSPHFLHTLKRVRFREAITFDSSATPKPGERRRQPKKLAEIDMAALADRMAEAIERKKAEDPAELRKQLAALRRDHDTEKAQWVTEISHLRELVAEAPTEEVRVPVLNDDAAEKLRAATDGMRDVLDMTRAAYDDLERTQDMVVEMLKAAPAAKALIESSRRSAPWPAQVAEATASEEVGNVTGSDRRVLDALAWLESIGIHPARKEQVGFLARYKITGGRFSNVLADLKRRGLIHSPGAGMLELGTEGRKHADVPPAPLTTAALHAAVLERLTPSQCAVMQPLLDVWPNALSRAELANRSHYDAHGGRFANLVGELVRLGLADRPTPGHVAAADVMFIKGRH